MNSNKYWVAHLLANQCWADLDLVCSTILLNCSATSTDFPSAQAERLNQINPTKVRQEMGHQV